MHAIRAQPQPKEQCSFLIVLQLDAGDTKTSHLTVQFKNTKERSFGQSVFAMLEQNEGSF